MSFPTVLVFFGAGYLLLTHYLRYNRKTQLLSIKTSSSSPLTLSQAHSIQLALFQLEFPFVAQKALEFALFKTYGIPSISSLLVATKQLSSSINASKRMADTSVLMLEIINNAPASERSTSALARTNYMHSLYGSKISNADLLYTLSLFLLEPIRWINLYEWRQLTNVEVEAMGLFWYKVGQAMGISYADMQGNAKWRDGKEFMLSMQLWSKKYEQDFMLPAQSNKDTADHTTALLLYPVPAFLKAFGKKIITALMEPRLRRAMLYPSPPAPIQILVDTLITTRKLILRHLTLPRPYSQPKQIISDTVNADNHINILIWDREPWYVEASFTNRWSLQSWLDWMAGKPIPGDEPEKYMAKGFKAEEVGPAFLKGKGVEEMGRDVDKIGRIMRPDVTMES